MTYIVTVATYETIFKDVNLLVDHIHQQQRQAAVAEVASGSVRSHQVDLAAAAAVRNPALAAAAAAAAGVVRSRQVVAEVAVVPEAAAPAVAVVHSRASEPGLDSHQSAADLRQLKCKYHTSMTQSSTTSNVRQSG